MWKLNNHRRKERQASLYYIDLGKSSNPKRSQIRPHEKDLCDWDFLLHTEYNDLTAF